MTTSGSPIDDKIRNLAQGLAQGQSIEQDSRFQLAHDILFEVYKHTGEDLIRSGFLSSFDNERQGVSPWKMFNGDILDAVLNINISSIGEDVDHSYRSDRLSRGLRIIATSDEYDGVRRTFVHPILPYYPKSDKRHRQDIFSRTIHRLKKDHTLASVLVDRYQYDWLRATNWSELDSLMPMPAPTQAKNQIIPLAEALCTKLGLAAPPLDTTSLEKSPTGQEQKNMKGSLRRTMNVAGAFRVTSSGQENVVGKIIGLIDDNWTTGITADDAKRALYEAGASKVIIIPFGQSIPESEIQKPYEHEIDIEAVIREVPDEYEDIARATYEVLDDPLIMDIFSEKRINFIYSLLTQLRDRRRLSDSQLSSLRDVIKDFREGKATLVDRSDNVSQVASKSDPILSEIREYFNQREWYSPMTIGEEKLMDALVSIETIDDDQGVALKAILSEISRGITSEVQELYREVMGIISQKSALAEFATKKDVAKLRKQLNYSLRTWNQDWVINMLRRILHPIRKKTELFAKGEYQLDALPQTALMMIEYENIGSITGYHAATVGERQAFNFVNNVTDKESGKVQDSFVNAFQQHAISLARNKPLLIQRFTPDKIADAVQALEGFARDPRPKKYTRHFDRASDWHELSFEAKMDEVERLGRELSAEDAAKVQMAIYENENRSSNQLNYRTRQAIITSIRAVDSEESRRMLTMHHIDNLKVDQAPSQREEIISLLVDEQGNARYEDLKGTQKLLELVDADFFDRGLSMKRKAIGALNLSRLVDWSLDLDAVSDHPDEILRAVSQLERIVLHPKLLIDEQVRGDFSVVLETIRKNLIEADVVKGARLAEKSKVLIERLEAGPFGSALLIEWLGGSRLSAGERAYALPTHVVSALSIPTQIARGSTEFRIAMNGQGRVTDAGVLFNASKAEEAEADQYTFMATTSVMGSGIVDDVVEERFAVVASAALRRMGQKVLILWDKDLVDDSVGEANTTFSKLSNGKSPVFTVTPDTIGARIAEHPDYNPVIVYAIENKTRYQRHVVGHGAVAVKRREGLVPHANRINVYAAVVVGQHHESDSALEGQRVADNFELIIVATVNQKIPGKHIPSIVHVKEVGDFAVVHMYVPVGINPLDLAALKYHIEVMWSA